MERRARRVNVAVVVASNEKSYARRVTFGESDNKETDRQTENRGAREWVGEMCDGAS